MKNTFKKITASIMAVASLTVSAVGIGANAATASDSYSTFGWSWNGSRNTVSITNSSGATRYAQVNAYGYNAAGAYVGHIGNDEKYLSDNATLSDSGDIYGATSITYGGILYTSTVPVGTPLSSWTRSRRLQ